MIGRNLPHPPPNQQWHDIYDHCHNCKQVHVKNEMVEIAINKRLCVECATKHIHEQDRTIAKWQECGDRIMEALFGKAAPLSDSDVIALIRHREEANDTAIKGLAKHVVDLNSREGYLVKLIIRAYNCKEWCECLDTLEPVVKEKESNDAK